jgi:hypothetical protein
VNALLQHVWGKSLASDRVWAQVTGMAPVRAVKRLLMALDYQAFIDGSYSKDEHVLAGYIATAETWAKFAKDWEELLPLGTRTKNGSYHFKMSEMARSPEGTARSELFYRVIEKHDLLPISCRMNIDDFLQAKQRLKLLETQWNWAINLGPWFNPYFFVFHALVDNFYKRRPELEKLIPLGERVNFIFDKQTEEALLPSWNDHVAARPEDDQRYYGAKPRFEDDQDFLALQAADLWAWWVRKWYEEDATDAPDRMKAFDFGVWRGKHRQMIAFSMNQDQILDMFQQIAFENLPFAHKNGQPIFDEE